jgi:ubiquitin
MQRLWLHDGGKTYNMLRKKIYSLHRTLSLIIAIPVLLWAASGFMHPIMTNIRPAVATQKIEPVAVEPHRIQVSLHDALQKNNIDHFHSIRLIHIDTNFFYQVQPSVNKAPVYLSTTNGKLLPSGDWLYAQYLARQFLEGASLPKHEHDRSATATATPVSFASDENHDCCNAATACVLQHQGGSSIANVGRVTAFNEEYKSINRLLPVYKVSFNRADGIRVYVETTQDRFAFAMDNKRAVFDRVFVWLHTWSWLDALGNVKLLVIITVALLAFITSVLGIYIFFATKTKKPNGHALLKARRNHRYTAIVGALFTLLWSFSGAYHTIARFKPDTRDAFFVSNQFTNNFSLNVDQLQQIVQQPIGNINLVQIDSNTYWRVTTLPAHDHVPAAHMDLMKNMGTPMPAVTYINTGNYAVLAAGEEKYAACLATNFSHNAPNSIQQVTAVTKFNDEYNFTDKRLPVWKVSYGGRHHERYYIETSTGRLSSRVDDTDLAEGYSFSLFHKHHFMDWGGKTARDASTMVWAAVQVILVVVGLVLWRKYRQRRVS